MASDYYPDYEAPASANMPRDTGKRAPTSVKSLANAWSKSFPDPLIFTDAVEQFAKVSRFGWHVIDGICHGTCPPAEFLAPDLHRAIKDAEKLRDGFDALVRNGAGRAYWAATDPRYQRAKTIGLRVFHEAEKTINRAAKEHEELSNLDPRALMKNKEGDWSFWKGALMVGLGVVTISTFADLVRSLKGRD